MPNQPQPDPIEAAAKELFDAIAEYDGVSKAFHDILHSHFADALRAEKAMKLLESGKVIVERTLRDDRLQWRARYPSGMNSFYYAETMVDAVLKAAGEKSDA